MRMSGQRIKGKQRHPPLPLKVSGDKKKWVEIRGLFLVPPVAAQTDAEQKGFKIHGLERKGRQHRRKGEKYILSDVVV